PSSVPSASSENGRASPVGDRAGVLLKHTYMRGLFVASTPPVTTRSALPSASSFTAADTAASELAHAASTVQLVPCRSRRLAIRPATTLESRPGKESSCHGTYCSAIRSQTSAASASPNPCSRRALSHSG